MATYSTDAHGSMPMTEDQLQMVVGPRTPMMMKLMVFHLISAAANCLAGPPLSTAQTDCRPWETICQHQWLAWIDGQMVADLGDSVSASIYADG